MTKRLEWIEYLLIDVENEKDSNVKKYHPYLRIMVDNVRNKILSAEAAANQAQSVIPSIIDNAQEKYRITNLMKAIVQYIKKIT